jgi:hypothetical protein
MRSIVSVLSVLLLVSLVPAQNKPQAPADNPKQDTVRQMQERGASPMCPHEKRLCNGQGFHSRPDMMLPRCGGPGPGCAEMRGCNRFQGGPHFMNQCQQQCQHHRMHGFLKLLFLGVFILNILLTVIVSRDMARGGRFNGLWIPAVLIAGIPVSAIYALFRIGDKIQGKNNA